MLFRSVIHLSYGDQDLRAVAVPGERPSIGDNLGLVFEPTAVHLFDNATGLALRES